MVARRGSGDAGTAARILDVAERLLQDRGFNGFSYADVAAELQITKPALHYHFASKADLGEALINRYAARFEQALAGLDGVPGTLAKLSGYAGLYLSVLRQERMCLCGMLAAEYQTLPQPVRSSVLAFFDRNEAWLEQVLTGGRGDGSLRFSGPPRDTARMIIACLEGAMLVARPRGDTAPFEATAASLLASVSARPGEALTA
jgi:TetR/AcrR family transcriptional regulator, transcriptional repressor for nem operon